MNKKIFCIASLLALLSSVNISPNSQLVETKALNSDMDNVSLLDGEEFASTGAFYDDFSSGIDSTVWAISEKKWATTDNGGTRHENVSYDLSTKTVSFRALGDHYVDNEFINDNIGASSTDGKRTGGGLISRQEFTPGRFEISLRLAPRIGICNAFWLFNSSGNKYSEIDIELPGRTVINEENYYKHNNAIFSSWVGENEDIDRNSSTSTLSYYLNDNKFHTYAFDWYNSATHSEVDYYIDGVKLYTAYTKVPQYSAHLWLGAWVTGNPYFCGYPNFDTAYMSVDYVKYTPFKEQNYEILDVELTGISNVYPSSSTFIEKDEYSANGDFSGNDLTGYTLSNATITSTSEGNALTLTKGEDSSATAKYKIYSVTGIEKLNISFDYYNWGSYSLKFSNCSGENVGSRISVNTFSGGSWSTLNDTFTVPSDAYYIDLQFYTESEHTFFVKSLSINREYDKPVNKNDGSSYSFYTKNQNLETGGYIEQDLYPDNNKSHPWRVLKGSYYPNESSDTNRLALKESTILIDAISDTSNSYYPLAKAMDDSDRFNIGDETKNRMSNTGIIQGFDMTYFEDITFLFYSFALQTWQKISIFYSLDSGESWSYLKGTTKANIYSISDNDTFKYVYSASKDEIDLDYYSTIRFALVMTYFSGDDSISGVIINNYNDLKNNLDKDTNCSVNNGYISLLDYEYDSLSEDDLLNLENETMKNYSQSYAYGYAYLKRIWSAEGIKNINIISSPSHTLLIVISFSSFMVLFISIYLLRKRKNTNKREI